MLIQVNKMLWTYKDCIFVVVNRRLYNFSAWSFCIWYVVLFILFFPVKLGFDKLMFWNFVEEFWHFSMLGFVDVVRDDPTNNVPDTIFSKLGLQLHRRDQHPLGILKNTIYDYFDTNYSNKFDKFDELCPIVSVKQVKFFNLWKISI